MLNNLCSISNVYPVSDDPVPDDLTVQTVEAWAFWHAKALLAFILLISLSAACVAEQ